MEKKLSERPHQKSPRHEIQRRLSDGHTQEFKPVFRRRTCVGWRKTWMTALRPRWQHIDAASRESRTSISYHSFWGCLAKKMQSCPDNTYVAFATRVVPWYRLDAVGGRLHSAVCMAHCDQPAAFVWLCKPHTIEDHVLCHATVVSINRRTRRGAYPQQQSFAVCRGWQQDLKHTCQ